MFKTEQHMLYNNEWMLPQRIDQSLYLISIFTSVLVMIAAQQLKSTLPGWSCSFPDYYYYNNHGLLVSFGGGFGN